MASPHAAGVAALVISQFGRLGADGDIKLPPQTAENYLQQTAVDIGLPGVRRVLRPRSDRRPP